MENLYLLPYDTTGLGHRLIIEGRFNKLVESLNKKSGLPAGSISVFIGPSGHATVRFTLPCEKSGEIFEEIKEDYLARVGEVYKKRVQAELDKM